MKEPIIIYDIVSLPEYDTDQIKNFKELFDKFREMKTIFWDSSNGGHEPKLMDDDEHITYRIVDLNSSKDEEDK